MAAKAKAEAAAAGGGGAAGAQPRRFWDGFRWVEQFAATTVETNSNPVTRRDRRLYLGNLPPGLTAEQLREFLNEALRACGALTAGLNTAVISTWVSPDGKYAFVEFASVDCASVALGLNGISCLGTGLRVRHRTPSPPKRGLTSPLPLPLRSLGPTITRRAWRAG